MKAKQVSSVEKRADQFVDKASTSITNDLPSENPYITKQRLIYGYDLVDLLHYCDFVEVLYLLFKGELPDQKSKSMLEKLMIALCNPGPRHHATRAAMNAAVSKTKLWNLLPIGASLLSGENSGAEEVQNSMLFLKRSRRKDPVAVAQDLLQSKKNTDTQDGRLVAGFGERFSGLDVLTHKLANEFIAQYPDSGYLQWADSFVNQINKMNYGWLDTGLAAAVFLSIGFGIRAAPALFQYLSLPGVLAHGVEKANQPITEMPFISQKNYIIES